MLPDANTRKRLNIGFRRNQIAAKLRGWFHTAPLPGGGPDAQTHKENQEGLNEGFIIHIAAFVLHTQAGTGRDHPSQRHEHGFRKVRSPRTYPPDGSLDRQRLDLVRRRQDLRRKLHGTINRNWMKYWDSVRDVERRIVALEFRPKRGQR